MKWLDALGKKLAVFGIAALCFGYFASYIPYSMMTKMITKGLFAGQNGHGFDGFIIVPVTVLGSTVAMYAFLIISGWWRFATRSQILGFSVPRPRWITLISGICTSGIIITTTLAYTFDGISIVFAMLLMRGGVLLLAPVVDLIAIKRKRKIYWPSWVAAALSFAALFTAFTGESSLAMTFVAAMDITFYLLSYFLRLFIMSNHAKSNDVEERKRYFAEEKLVDGPALLLGLLIAGLIGSTMAPDALPAIVWRGFTEFPGQGFFWTAFLIGVFSTGTGLFGTLIFLDKRENTFTVAANRASSVFAGIAATWLLANYYGQKSIGKDEWIGVILILAAIVFLAYRSVVEKRRKKQRELFPELVPQPVVQRAETN